MMYRECIKLLTFKTYQNNHKDSTWGSKECLKQKKKTEFVQKNNSSVENLFHPLKHVRIFWLCFDCRGQKVEALVIFLLLWVAKKIRKITH
jgi:hypothetical protein